MNKKIPDPIGLDDFMGWLVYEKRRIINKNFPSPEDEVLTWENLIIQATHHWEAGNEKKMKQYTKHWNKQNGIKVKP